MSKAYFPMIFDFGTDDPVLPEADEPKALNFLTQADWEQISDKAQTATYEQGETILAKGDTRRAIFIIEKGTVRIEKATDDVIARRGPGVVFGEMSFLESSGASAWVIADEEVEVSVVEQADINELLSTTPGLAGRFYQTLAVTLAYRLRQASSLLADD